MGGSVEVRSGAARGSTFAFTVRLKADIRPLALLETEELDARKLRVYVADDDSRSLSELLMTLAAAGVEVGASGSAAGLPEALRAARAAGHPPDVAIVGHVRVEGGDLAIAKSIRVDPGWWAFHSFWRLSPDFAAMPAKCARPGIAPTFRGRSRARSSSSVCERP
jgi:hypothetical protein